LLKNINPSCVVILNQHIQDGSVIRYFPTDVLNGEVHLPPDQGHESFRTVDGKRYYLPLEFEPVSQRIPKGTATPWGRIGAWFTYGAGKGFPASEPFSVSALSDWIHQARARGAANVLLSCAPDHTGQFRVADARQLAELGRLLEARELSQGGPGLITR